MCFLLHKMCFTNKPSLFWKFSFHTSVSRPNSSLMVAAMWFLCCPFSPPPTETFWNLWGLEGESPTKKVKLRRHDLADSLRKTTTAGQYWTTGAKGPQAAGLPLAEAGACGFRNTMFGVFPTSGEKFPDLKKMAEVLSPVWIQPPEQHQNNHEEPSVWGKSPKPNDDSLCSNPT